MQSNTKETSKEILVILGPTASGKSSLAIELAKRNNGEIISADSRQVYTGLDIGTGKVTKEEMQGIPHYLLDIANPNDQYTVIEWKEEAEKKIEEILSRGKLPIMCGGTGFYIDAVVYNTIFPDVPADENLRAKLEQKTAEQLFEMLETKDPERAHTMDPYNKRRIIRALEIVEHLGKVPQLKNNPNPNYSFKLIGIEISDEVLRERINARLLSRIENGMIEEAQKLHAEGLSYERMNELGLEYRYLAELLQEKITKDEMIEILKAKIWHYARRQKAWFKRDKNIVWMKVEEILEQENL